MRCKPRERTLRIASSVGNAPRFLNVFRHESFRDSLAFMVYRTLRMAGGSSKKTVSRVQSRRQLVLIVGSCASHVRATCSKAASASATVGAPSMARRSRATACRCRHTTYRKECRTVCTMQRCTWIRGKIVSNASGNPVNPSTQATKPSLSPRCGRSVKTVHQNVAPSGSLTQRPQSSCSPAQVTPSATETALVLTAPSDRDFTTRRSTERIG